MKRARVLALRSRPRRSELGLYLASKLLVPATFAGVDVEALARVVTLTVLERVPTTWTVADLQASLIRHASGGEA